MRNDAKPHSTSLHPHGDGKYTTIGRNEHGAEMGKTEHESFGAAVMHMAKHHAEGDHMHIEGHEDGFTSHHMTDGAVKGPTEHKAMRELKKHVGDCMDGGE